MIKHFDRATAKALRPRLDAALAASPEFKKIAEEFGFTIRFGNGSFENTKLSIKLDIEIKGAIDPMLVEIAKWRGFDASRPSKDGLYMIKGHKPRSSKPWVMVKIGEEDSGKVWNAADGWCVQNFHPAVNPDASAPVEGHAEQGAAL